MKSSILIPFLLLPAVSFASETHQGSVNLSQPLPLKSADLITGKVDFKTSFSSVEQLCIKPTFESTHTWNLKLNVFNSNNQSVHSRFYSNGFESCTKVSAGELNDVLQQGLL